jgi:hypothetical protein
MDSVSQDNVRAPPERLIFRFHFTLVGWINFRAIRNFG